MAVYSQSSISKHSSSMYSVYTNFRNGKKNIVLPNPVGKIQLADLKTSGIALNLIYSLNNIPAVSSKLSMNRYRNNNNNKIPYRQEKLR